MCPDRGSPPKILLTEISEKNSNSFNVSINSTEEIKALVRYRIRNSGNLWTYLPWSDWSETPRVEVSELIPSRFYDLEVKVLSRSGTIAVKNIEKVKTLSE